MPRGNENNLVPQSNRTKEEQKRIAIQGGKASGEARRKKREIKEYLNILLESEAGKSKDGKMITGAEAMAIQAFKKAMSGDLKAWELVRDSAGQKPIERVVYAEVDADVIEEVERMVNDESN